MPMALCWPCALPWTLPRQPQRTARYSTPDGISDHCLSAQRRLATTVFSEEKVVAVKLRAFLRAIDQPPDVLDAENFLYCHLCPFGNPDLRGFPPCHSDPF